MKKRELILVTGISGAGKTITMDYFESAGFYCIDNLPINALFETLRVLQADSYFFEYAIAINSNASEEDIVKALQDLNSLEWLSVKILFLEVSDEELVKRFQFTRKKHPFSNRNTTLYETIERERELLENLKKRSTFIVDTSDFDDSDLKERLSTIFDYEIVPKFHLTFVSFGYKKGLPNYLDYVIDSRFIPNPYYIEELRNKTGNEKEVYDYVMKQKETYEYLDLLIPFLDYSIDKHSKTNRSYLSIGIGCTGGQHRSVVLVNYLSQYYKEKYNIIKDHRDAKKM